MRRILWALLGWVLTGSICAGEPAGAVTKPESASVPDQAAQSLDTLADKARKERDAFAAQAQKDMDELKLRIAALRNKAKKLGGEADAEFDKQIGKLEREQSVAQRKLARLKAVAGAKWRTFKADVSTAIEHLGQSVDKTQKSSD